MGKFPDEEVKKALANADKRCECTRTNPDCIKKHNRERCQEGNFTMGNRGIRWDAIHRTSNEAGGKDIASNCEILCWYCLKKIGT